MSGTAATRPSATVSGSATTIAALLASLPSTAEKNKQIRRELLMERLRFHASQHKTFPDIAKSMRMSMLEKRFALDAVEKTNLQKCLDSMQHCIQVSTREGLVERLENLSRQLGLKFVDDKDVLYISTDMFFLEIILNLDGSLSDVKVHHECKIEQQSCIELVECLNKGDFADFTVQLEGLTSIYQLNAEPKLKAKAFLALQAIEADLLTLSKPLNAPKGTQQLYADSQVGIVLQRRGGHPMKLTYFISPHSLISIETNSFEAVTFDNLTLKDFGFSGSVHLEASSAKKLQILPTVSISQDPQTGDEKIVYAPLTPSNSLLLPATFVLRLNTPLPVCYKTWRLLTSGSSTLDEELDEDSVGGNGLEEKESNQITAYVMKMVLQTASEDPLKNPHKGLFVSLPDQTHCYYFTENEHLTATLVSSIAFTEPAQVPEIIRFLKTSALFYTLLSSCIRPQTKMGNDMDSTMIMEIVALSFKHISVTLQHPYEECLSTVEFTFDSGDLNCTIITSNSGCDILSTKLTKVARKCLSIPITIRALLRFWDHENLKIFQCNMSTNGSNGSTNSLNNNGPGSNFSNFGITIGTNGDSGGGSNSNPVSGPIKTEFIIRQPLPATTAAGNMTSNNVPAGFLVYKGGEIVTKEEDFHESPKSQTHVMPTTANASTAAAAAAVMAQSVETCSSSSSLGSLQIQQQQQLPDTTKVAKATDIEIADKYKNIWKDKTPNLKSSLSITAISSCGVSSSTSESSSSSKTIAAPPTLDVKRTGGIEIIPLMSQLSAVPAGSGGPCTTTTPSTITITPITTAPSIGASSLKEKKLSQSSNSSSGSSSSSSKRNLESSGLPTEGQKERKRKKKRDDSPMGPPDKVYSRQNSPASTCDASGVAAVARKFSSPSSSPKGGSGGLMAGSSSFPSTRPSPKHSPVYSSPKHNTASNSPKSPFGTHSPKHGSAGKPSMSTLKSATATGMSPKGDKSVVIGTGSGSVSSSSSSTSNLARSYGSLSENRIIPPPSGSSSISSSSHKREKDKSNAPSPASSPSLSPASLPTASLKANLNLSNLQQQQIKSSVPSHMATGGAVGGSNNGSNTSTLDQLNPSLRKGLASSTAVGMMATGGSVTTTGGSGAATLSPAQESSCSQSPCHQDCTNQDPCNLPSCPLSQLGNSTEYDDYDDFDESPSLDEYMVRRAQEGLKLTLNKTSSKASPTSSTSSSSSSSKSKSSSVGGGGGGGTVGSASGTSGSTSLSHTTTSSGAASGSGGSSSHKKHHTGLKPGVHSGPASKKSLHSSSHPSSSSGGGSSKSGGSGSGGSGSSGSKVSFQKSSSSGNLSSKLSSSASSGNSSSGSGGSGLARSSSTNSFASGANTSGTRGKSSSSSSGASSGSGAPNLPGSRLDPHTDMLKLLHLVSPSMAANMEGFMKGINSKFQIPKLSQRANNANTTASSTSASAATTTTSAPGFSASSSTTATTSSNPVTASSTLLVGSGSSTSLESLNTSGTTQTSQTQSTQQQDNKSRDQCTTSSLQPPPPFPIGSNNNPSANTNVLSGVTNSNTGDTSGLTGISTTPSGVSLTSASPQTTLSSIGAIGSSTSSTPAGTNTLQNSANASPIPTNSLSTDNTDEASQSVLGTAGIVGLPPPFTNADDTLGSDNIGK